MLKSVAIGTILCVGFGLAFTSPAVAQGLGNYASGPGAYTANPYSSPPVSPYINLGINPSNGLSNYQSLVRPLIDEREAMQRQVATLQQLQQQMRQSQFGQATQDPNRQDPKERPWAKHFMQYSHYYGGLR
ncbi:MAG: hypothetical protein HY288_12600 [Planctomycetia bacterium]|nr:hypothetical protein [Planctomycetia bacterium]